MVSTAVAPQETLNSYRLLLDLVGLPEHEQLNQFLKSLAIALDERATHVKLDADKQDDAGSVSLSISFSALPSGDRSEMGGVESALAGAAIAVEALRSCRVEAAGWPDGETIENAIAKVTFKMMSVSEPR